MPLKDADKLVLLPVNVGCCDTVPVATVTAELVGTDPALIVSVSFATVYVGMDPAELMLFTDVVASCTSAFDPCGVHDPLTLPAGVYVPLALFLYARAPSPERVPKVCHFPRELNIISELSELNVTTSPAVAVTDSPLIVIGFVLSPSESAVVVTPRYLLKFNSCAIKSLAYLSLSSYVLPLGKVIFHNSAMSVLRYSVNISVSVSSSAVTSSVDLLFHASISSWVMLIVENGRSTI